MAYFNENVKYIKTKQNIKKYSTTRIQTSFKRNLKTHYSANNWPPGDCLQRLWFDILDMWRSANCYKWTIEWMQRNVNDGATPFLRMQSDSSWTIQLACLRNFRTYFIAPPCIDDIFETSCHYADVGLCSLLYFSRLQLVHCPASKSCGLTAMRYPNFHPWV